MLDFTFTNEINIGDIIAFLCLLGSVFIYFKFDKKLNIQKEQINEQQILLNQIKIDEYEMQKTAELHLSIIALKDQPDTWLFVIDNRGSSPATNIMIDMSHNFSLRHEFLITSLQPNQIFPVYKFQHLSFHNSGPFKTELRWKDLLSGHLEIVYLDSTKYVEYDNTLSYLYGDNYIDFIEPKAFML